MVDEQAKQQITDKVKSVALDHGADLVGVLNVRHLPEHSEDIERLLPGAKSVLIIAAKHSIAALRSGANELAQFDTIHTYNESARAAHSTARHIESQGFPAAGVHRALQTASVDLRQGTPRRNRTGANGVARHNAAASRCRGGIQTGGGAAHRGRGR